MKIIECNTEHESVHFNPVAQVDPEHEDANIADVTDNDQHAKQEELEKKVRDAYKKVNGFKRKTQAEAMKIGAWLNQLKPLVGHTKWTDYVKNTLEINPRTATQYMLLDTHKDLLKTAENTDLGIAESLREIRNSNKPEPESKEKLRLANGSEVVWRDGLITRCALERAITKIVPASDQKQDTDEAAKRQNMIIRIAKTANVSKNNLTSDKIKNAREALKAVEELLDAAEAPAVEI